MPDWPSGERNPFHHIFGRALTDEAYRARLIGGDRDEQRAALVDAGVADPTDEQLDQLNDAVDSLRVFSQAFDIQRAAS